MESGKIELTALLACSRRLVLAIAAANLSCACSARSGIGAQAGNAAGAAPQAAAGAAVVGQARGANGVFGPFSLNAGQDVQSGNLRLAMQTDGNLVLYNSAGTALWNAQSNNACTGGCHASFQSDGNLVVYNGSTAVWNSGTFGNSGATLVFSGSAPYMEIVNSSQAQLWTAVTYCQPWAGASGTLQAFVNQYLCAALPAGTFVVSSPIYLPSGHTLTGQGSASVLQASQSDWQFGYDDAVVTSVNPGSPSTDYFWTNSGPSVTVSNFTIDAAGIATYAIGFGGYTANNMTLTNGRCSAAGYGAPGVVVENSILTNSALTVDIPGRGSINCASGGGGLALGAALYGQPPENSAGTGTTIDGADYAPVIDNNQIFGNYGPALDNNNVWGGTFTNNNVYDNAGWAAVSLYASSGWNVGNNTITQPASQAGRPDFASGPDGEHSAGIFVAESTVASTTSLLSSTNNWIHDNSAQGWYGIILTGQTGVSTPVPVGNTIENNNVMGSTVGCGDNAIPGQNNWTSDNCAGVPDSSPSYF